MTRPITLLSAGDPKTLTPGPRMLGPPHVPGPRTTSWTSPCTPSTNPLHKNIIIINKREIKMTVKQMQE